ncbi:hypothetical protein [Niastella yeongjuensis]|nr:hypothetical protein [Niastella yeongjuensis]SEO84340.1 hypothetical protein SAMN05660816_03710 [Niastella yeongjuensis]
MKIMYRSLGLVAVLALSTLLHSCDKVKDAISINIPTQTVNAEFTIQPQANGTQSVTTFQYGVNLDSLIKIQNTSLGIGNIKSAKIKSVTLTLTSSTASDNLGAFSAAEVGLSSSAKPDFTAIAGLTSIPDANQTTLEIPVNSVELKDYFSSTSFTYKLTATTRRATSTTMTGKATIKFDVTAGL